MIVISSHFVVSSGKLCYERQRKDHLACFIAVYCHTQDLEVSAILSEASHAGRIHRLLVYLTTLNMAFGW